MVYNNGLAERQNKIKLTAENSSNIVNQYEETPLFTVEATGENVQYQWQYCLPNKKDWLKVPNGISPNLKLSEISPNLNGTKFRCKIYNDIGSIFSDIVTLNVNVPTSAPVIVTQPSDITVDPTNESDIFDSVYAAVVVNLNGGGTGGGTTSDIVITTDINNTSNNAVPNAKTTKSAISAAMATHEIERKFVYTNKEILKQNDGVIIVPIQHNLNDRFVSVNLIENNSGEYNPFVCGIEYDSEDSIILTINSDYNLAVGQITVVITK